MVMRKKLCAMTNKYSFLFLKGVQILKMSVQSSIFDGRGLSRVKIKVHYLGFIRKLINQSEDEFELEEGASLSVVLDRIAGLYGQPFKNEFYEPGLKDVKMGFVVTVNGVLMSQLHGVDTQLNNGDNITLMSLMSGG
jgi:molybdopterin converting factor small subunit